MKSLRVVLLLAAGVLWFLLAPQNIVLRYVSLIAVMSVVYAFSVVALGEEVALQESNRQR